MTVETIVCTDIDPTSRCALISADYGVDCAYPTGTECLAVDEEDNLFQYFCLGTGGGCVETKDEAICAQNVGPCTVDQVGTCTGDNLLFDCLETQPWVVDCASFGGNCSTGACRELELGAYCDSLQFFCKSSDLCFQNTCAPNLLDGGVYDSGIVPADAGDGVPSRMDAGVSNNNNNNNNNNSEEDDGCSSTGPSTGAALLFSLLALGVIARRRS
jgi:uncharacterized protein (TIGR03382 family)